VEQQMTKENTWRALNDLPPIMNWKCRIGWHRWTTYTIHERNHEFMVPIARSNCASCGLPRFEHPYTKGKKT
jgi:NAD-dependent dihydropyrimidine dehydrogenase PreA subunit